MTISKFKNLTRMLIGITGIVWLFGCGHNHDNPINSLPSEAEMITEAFEKADQKTTFFLTDAPSDDFQSVSVDVLSPIKVTMDGAIVDVPLPENLPIRVDLLELDGVSDLLTSAILPAGTISKIVLPLANPEIVLLDDTVLDSSDIDFPTPELVVSPENGILIKRGEGESILIDFDVASSFAIDLAGTEGGSVSGLGKPRMATATSTPKTDRLSFQPKGAVKPTDKGNRPEGMKAPSIKGEIARIPGIKDMETSFLVKHRFRQSLLPVAVSATSTIRTFDGPSNFTSLQVGQQVEINGSFSKGTLQAKSILILPKDYKGANGMLTDLTATSFNVLLAPDRATSTASERKQGDMDKTRKKVKVIYSPATPILLQNTDTKGEVSHLANGQRVEVLGQASAETDVIDARSITISPSHIRGFVTRAADCNSSNKQIRLISVPMHKEAEKPVGAVAAATTPDAMLVSWVVEINEAKLIDEKGTVMECSALKKGMAVKAFGMILPSPSDPLVKNTMKALEVKQVSLDYIEGIVDSLLPDGKGLMLSEVTTKGSFFGTSSASSTPREGAPARQFKLKVVLSEYLKDEGFVLEDTLVTKKIHIAGFFRSMERNATSSTIGETGSSTTMANQRKPRDHYFIAFVIQKGSAPLPPSPTTPPTTLPPTTPPPTTPPPSGTTPRQGLAYFAPEGVYMINPGASLPGPNLASYMTNPDIAGFYVVNGWSTIQPDNPGQFDWRFFDDWVSYVQNFTDPDPDKQRIARSKKLSFGIRSGLHTSSDGVSPYGLPTWYAGRIFEAADGSKGPVSFESYYKTHWIAAWKELAARYETNPTVSQFHLGGIYSWNTLDWSHPMTPSDIAKWIDTEGYTRAKLQTFAEEFFAGVTGATTKPLTLPIATATINEQTRSKSLADTKTFVMEPLFNLYGPNASTGKKQILFMRTMFDSDTADPTGEWNPVPDPNSQFGVLLNYSPYIAGQRAFPHDITAATVAQFADISLHYKIRYMELGKDQVDLLISAGLLAKYNAQLGRLDGDMANP